MYQSKVKPSQRARDLEALKEGGYIDVVDRMMEPVTMSLDDHAPEVIAYWAKLGMVKEFHGEDVPMSWTEYAANTGYVWIDENKQGPQNNFKKWIKAAGIRAIKTVAQSAIATIGTSAFMGDVNWVLVGSASLLAGILSLLTSVAGLPEVDSNPEG